KSSAWKPAGLISRWKPEWSTERIASLVSILGALFWGLLAGLLVFIPIGYFYSYRAQSAPLRGTLEFTRKSLTEINTTWDLYRRLEKQNRFLGEWSPVRSLDEPVKANLLAAAAEVIDRYRATNDPVLEHFDWQKAQVSLEHAADMGDRGSQV